jgi:hypothetical protein
MPSLVDLELTPSTTREQVRAVWGDPTPGGPAGEMATYWLENRELQVWLSFSSSEPHELTRAILLDWHNPVVPKTKMLLNRIEATKTRRRNQLDFRRPLTAADVYAVWGPPDSVAGSGIEHWGYAMADGTVASLIFDGERVLGSGTK